MPSAPAWMSLHHCSALVGHAVIFIMLKNAIGFAGAYKLQTQPAGNGGCTCLAMRS
jgi:hypothetical protein